MLSPLVRMQLRTEPGTWGKDRASERVFWVPRELEEGEDKEFSFCTPEPQARAAMLGHSIYKGQARGSVAHSGTQSQPHWGSLSPQEGTAKCLTCSVFESSLALAPQIPLASCKCTLSLRE